MAAKAFTDRRELLGVVGSLLALLALCLGSLLAPDDVVPSMVVLVAPLVAGTLVRPRWTGVVSLCALGAGAVLIAGDDLSVSAVVARLVIVGFVAVVAIWLSFERVDRERDLAISSTRQQFADLAQTSTDFIGIVGADGKVFYINPAGLAMVGLEDLDELRSVDVLEFFPDDLHEFVRDTLNAELRTEGHWLGEITFRRFDTGAPVEIEMLAFVLGEGRRRMIATVSRDISERKRHAGALEMSELRYRTLVEATSAVTWTADPQGRFVEPQASWSAFTGQAPSACEGFGWADAIHPEDIDEVWSRWNRAVASKSFYAADPRLWHEASQSYRWVVITGAPVIEEDEIRGWFGAVLDVDARRQAEDRASEAAHRLHLIMQAAPVGIAFFGPDLRYLMLNERLAELNGVPRDDHIGRSIADVTPSLAPTLFPLLLRVFETGLPALDVEVAADLGHTPGSAEVWLLSLVPVEDVNGDRVGVGVTVVDVTDRDRRERELRDAFEDRDHIARALQNALLPPELPVLPGVEVHAQYLPAGTGSEVGGDFYDVIEDGSGRWHVVVGDICGKGPDAAALTGLARHTLRAAAIGDGDPVELVELVNETLRREDTDRFLTLVDLMLDLRDDRPVVTTVLAGHPPPLLLRHGAVTELGRYGGLLGVFDAVRLEPTVDSLQPGDVVVAYTDGLIEHQGPTVFGESELRLLLASCAGLDGAATSQRITERVAALRSTETSDDDVAFLVLSLAPEGSPDSGSGPEGDGEEGGVVERCADFPPLTSSPGQARRFLNDLLTTWQCEDAVEVAELLVSELVGNAVQHAHSATRVTATLTGGRLRVAVRDRDHSPLVPRRGGPFAPNGRGLLILESLADDWGVEDERDGKVVWFELHAGGARDSPPWHSSRSTGPGRTSASSG